MRVGERPKRLWILWLVVVVTTLLGAAAGYAGGTIKAPTYTSVSQLMWDPSAQRYTDATAYVPDSVSLGVQVQGLILKLSSDAVITPAAEALGIDATDVRGAMTTSIAPGSSALNIAVEADSPDLAQSINAALVKSFTDNVTGYFVDQYTAQVKSLDSSIKEVTDELEPLKNSDALYGSLSGQLATMVAQQEALKAKADAPTTPLSVYKAPTVPVKPSSLPPLTLAVLGGALGFLIGLAILALVRLRGSSAAKRA